MADNVTVDNGDGTDYSVSTDDAGADGHVQRVKVAYSADGVATHVTADADGLLVNLGANNDVTVSGVATAANQSTIAGHLDGVETLLGTIDADTSSLAGTVAGTELQVDIVSSALPTGAATAANQATIAGHLDGVEGLLTTIDADTSALAGAVSGAEVQVDVVTSALPSGAATSAKQDTVIGHLDGVEGLLTTIDADTSALAGAVSGTEVQVDVVGALPAGTNAIGKLAANSGVDIGDVDVTSVPADPFGANADAAATAGSTGSIQAKLRLMTSQLDAIKTAVETLDNTVGGSELQVDVVSSALPSGGATAANQTTIAGHLDGVETLLGTIDADTSTLAGAVSGTEMQVDIVSAPTLTVNSHAVTNAGTFAVQVDGSALTALQLIDDPVVADDAAFTPGTTKVMMAGFEADEASIDSVDEGDGGAARMTLDRKVIVQPQPHTAGGLSIFRSIDLDESEEEVKASAGQLYGWYISNAATSARFVKFYNATAANVTVGTTTPVMTLLIPGNSSDDVGANALGGMGIVFDTAISVAATTAVADNDTGAPGANEVIVNLFYK